MRVRLVRVDPDRGPDVIVALGGTEDVAPFALAGRDVEEAGDTSRPCVGKHLVLPLGEARIIQVAVAVDQPHAASSSLSSRRGNKGCGCAIGCPPLPLSIRVRSLSADSGITGATASVSLRTAATKVPRTCAMRFGSVLRRAQGAVAST